jgi:peptidoglycan/LPS O-acetylase OafA/YrhL
MHKSLTKSASNQLSLSALDALRGLAALYVMLSHVRWFLWASQKEYVDSGQGGIGAFIAASSALLAYSHHAVLLFFLISGFCIHHRQAKLMMEGASSTSGKKLFDVPSFAWRRARRLYPMLLVALILTGLMDYLGNAINPAFYAGQTGYPGIDYLPRPDFSAAVLIGNLLMQGGLVVPAFGNNMPLWSLAWECWFYVLYPVVLWLSVRARSLGMLAVVSAVSAFSLAYGQSTPIPGWVRVVLTYWIVWVLGAAIAEAYVGRLKLPGLRLAAPLALIAALAVMLELALRHVMYLGGGNVTFNDPGTDLMLSMAFAVLLAYVMLGLPRAVRPVVESAARRLRPLGDISYSLYIVHYPLIVLISALWLSRRDRLPLGAELAVPGAISALALGWVCWFAVERFCVSQREPGRVKVVTGRLITEDTAHVLVVSGAERPRVNHN